MLLRRALNGLDVCGHGLKRCRGLQALYNVQIQGAVGVGSSAVLGGSFMQNLKHLMPMARNPDAATA